MIRYLIRSLVAVCVGLPTVAHSTPVLVGHFAPGLSPIQVELDGKPVGLFSYREMRTIDIDLDPSGAFALVARDATTGEVLHEKQVTHYTPKTGELPSLFFAGDRTSQPLGFYADPGPTAVREELASRPGFEGGFRPGTHETNTFSLASFPGAEVTATAIRGEEQCHRPNPLGGTTLTSRFRPVYAPTDSWPRWNTSELSTSDGWNCRIQLQMPGRLLELTFPFNEKGLYRVFAFGNGNEEPFEAIAMYGDRIVATAGDIPVQPSALLRSANHWYDAARPAHGLYLYEDPASGLVVGLYFTFEESGRPVWYVLDGERSGIDGRRDARLYLSKRGPDGSNRLEPAGEARITYAGCNEAEFRATLDGEVRVASARRSTPVERCSELD